MPQFRYKSVAESGEIVEGRLDAADRSAVVARLHQLGHVPVRIEPVASGFSLHFLQREVFAERQASRLDIVTLTREIATLLAAGLPLDRALEILRDLTKKPALKKLVQRILEQVRGGGSLADALEREGRAFPDYYRSMVRAGEAGATLEAVLTRLADFMERGQAIRSSVRSALIYPVFLLVTAGLSVFVLLIYVIPTFKPMFDDAGADLPLATRLVIGMGDFMQQAWWLLALGFLLLYLVAKAVLARPAIRLWWHGRLLRLPLIGSLWLRIDVGRFSRTLGTLLSNGVPLLTALPLVRDVMGNLALAGAIDVTIPDVRAGKGLADPLAGKNVFPDLAIQLLRVGEESGHLEDMLLKLAEIYDQETTTAVRRMLAMLVPLLTLGLGVVIAFIILSILLALFSINELAL